MPVNPNTQRLRQENYTEIEASPGYMVTSSLKRKWERKQKDKVKHGLGLWHPFQINVIKMKETIWEAEAIGDCLEFEARLGYVVSSGTA